VLDRPVPMRLTKPLPKDVSRPRLRDAVPMCIGVFGEDVTCTAASCEGLLNNDAGAFGPGKFTLWGFTDALLCLADRLGTE